VTGAVLASYRAACRSANRHNFPKRPQHPPLLGPFFCLRGGWRGRRQRGPNGPRKGAASGIGEATARRFSGEGAKVVLVDQQREALEKVAAELPSDRTLAHVADVSGSRRAPKSAGASVTWNARSSGKVVPWSMVGFRELRPDFYEAEFDAVWRSPDHVLVDVTPPTRRREGNSLFTQRCRRRFQFLRKPPRQQPVEGLSQTRP
jgi:hypothetical protein